MRTYDESARTAYEAEREAIAHMEASDRGESDMNHLDIAFRASKRASIAHMEASTTAPDIVTAKRHEKASAIHESGEWTFEEPTIAR